MRPTNTFFLFGLLLSASASGADTKTTPRFDLRIKPLSMDEPRFAISGSISYCADDRKVSFFVPRRSTFSFTRNGVPLDVSPNDGIDWPCDKRHADAGAVRFQGMSPEGIRKCGASHNEVFCLNNSVPNPEVMADWSLYRIRFDLPGGYGALVPDSSVELNTGIQFQIAKFRPAQNRKTKRFAFEYRFPSDFHPTEAYLVFLEETMEGYSDLLGDLPFKKIKVGAIRRDEKRGEISGSPSGNLLLFSRTAFHDKPNLEGLRSVGIDGDVSDALRKMVIAHELSHFWFSRTFMGKDGWMVEGIPNYLGLVAVRKGSPKDYAELRKLYEYADARGPQGAIPNHPFGDGPLYVRAYYQGAFALVKLGEELGHENIIGLISAVYQKNADPEFADFDREFRKTFPSRTELWERAWRIGEQ
ncbi:MAG: hypothetical protein Q8T11_06525 [Elusimicrobiota bacterium]|nr:hypothetical protein [Elusimicrobiota bacterium]